MGRRQPASYDAVILDRRRTVAALRLRGMTFHEIMDGLTRLKKLNPETGKPWSYQTIHADWKAIENDWMKSARNAIEKQRARANAELEEIKRESWKKEDHSSVMRAIEQQRKLLGLDVQQNETQSLDISLNVKKERELTEDELNEELIKRGLPTVILEE